MKARRVCPNRTTFPDSPKMASGIDPTLSARIANDLPKNFQLTLHHISSEPIPCPELFSAPPNQDPEVTVCESHFLSASIAHNGAQVHAFALEVLTYTTDTLTTLFVSKADSTGYLHLLEPPRWASSPLRTVISNFLGYLVETNYKSDRRLVLSLFARAQDQYLFPGSIENNGKHVLDDRGLIKWWCKIFESILRKYPTASTSTLQSSEKSSSATPSVRAYLVVPGCDKYETRAFFPNANLLSPPRWLPTDPLRCLGKPLGIPERCLIPRFPDDPKARFVVDLDDELPENGPQPQDSPLKNPHPGKWRSVRTLEQFWEFMAFRQECSAGRVVGFLWAVFEPPDLQDRPSESRAEQDGLSSYDLPKTVTMLPTPDSSQAVEPSVPHLISSHPTSPPPEPALAPISTSQLEPIGLQSSPSTIPSLKLPETKEEMPSSTLPPAINTRGELILPEPAYKRAIDILLTLDYADIAIATDSTQKFIAGVAEVASVPSWGTLVIGQEEEIPQASLTAAIKSDTTNGIPVLGAGLVRKKKRPASEVDAAGTTDGAAEDGREAVQVLSSDLVRKKPKVQ